MLRGLVTNLEIETQLTELHSRLNLDSSIHLFTNPSLLARGMVPGDFVEASYRGYEAADLTDSWFEPVKRHDGVWSIMTPIFAWTPSAEGVGPTSQAVRGWYILSAGSLSFAGLFPAPINLQLGSRPLEFAAEVQLSDGIVFLSLSLI